MGGSDVTAPLAGTVVETTVSSGDRVPAGLPAVSVRVQQFAIAATVPAVDAYRVYRLPTRGVTDVTGGSGGDDCTIATPPRVDGHEPGELPVLCVLPRSAAVVEGLPAKVGIKTGSAKRVLVLPVSVVRGDTKHGVVGRYANGEVTDVRVELGISDGLQVEIRSGLAEGDEVIAFPPGLR